ncbi:unnamed protein product [Paramecium sonneborni]|uniref:Uncharacterized protein n=1 Tax=Paramecium sonneborni TaxID=65129 RepID=A0A8S1QXF1_9CILI|nr:unnamed protein product [Paramecium sonneborni]
MLKLNYISEEIYICDCLDKIEKILEFDNIGQYSINPKNNSITYYINHEKCIRLRDLLFWIDQDFVRIHLGQILILSLKLLEKVQLLESQNILHYFLDQNRIWLELEPSSQYPSIIYQFLNYSIHFTGYRCQFMKQKTVELKHLEKQKIFTFDKIHLNKQVTPLEKKNIKKQILEPIIDKCNPNIKIQDIINIIKIKLQEYQYKDDQSSKFVQSLDIDDNKNDYIDSERYKLIEKVNIQINKIVEQKKNYQQIFIDFFLQQYIQLISKNLKSCLQINLDFDKKAQELQDFLTKNKSDLKENIKDYVHSLIENYLKKYEKYFKFSISESEFKSLEKEVINSIMQSQTMKYYNNTYWFYSNNIEICKFMIQAVKKILDQEVRDQIELFYMYKILMLIDDLI